MEESVICSGSLVILQVGLTSRERLIRECMQVCGDRGVGCLGNRVVYRDSDSLKCPQNGDPCQFNGSESLLFFLIFLKVREAARCACSDTWGSSLSRGHCNQWTCTSTENQGVEVGVPHKAVTEWWKA